MRTGSYLAAAVDQARFGAEKIRKLLRADVGDLKVKPVVVCWGSGVANVDKGHRWCDDVLVVVGRQGSEVVDVINKKVLDAFTIDCAVQALEAFVVDRERYARRRRA